MSSAQQGRRARVTKIRSDGRTITVRMPISIQKRGGRKLVSVPDGAPMTTARGQHVNGGARKAIERVFRWRDVLGSGRHSTIKEIAQDEQITLHDIRAHLLKLPESEHDKPAWRAATDAVLNAAEGGNVKRAHKAFRFARFMQHDSYEARPEPGER
jgi:hypothetical protein